MTIDTCKTIYVCTDSENGQVKLLLPKWLGKPIRRPHHGSTYNQIPGYEEGKGCPVCGANHDNTVSHGTVELDITELRIDNPDPESTDAAEYRLLQEEMQEYTFDI